MTKLGRLTERRLSRTQPWVHALLCQNVHTFMQVRDSGMILPELAQDQQAFQWYKSRQEDREKPTVQRKLFLGTWSYSIWLPKTLMWVQLQVDLQIPFRYMVLHWISFLRVSSRLTLPLSEATVQSSMVIAVSRLNFQALSLGRQVEPMQEPLWQSPAWFSRGISNPYHPHRLTSAHSHLLLPPHPP